MGHGRRLSTVRGSGPPPTLRLVYDKVMATRTTRCALTLTALLPLVGIAVGAVGCGNKKTDEGQTPTPAPSSTLPADSAQKGQLLEGKEEIFGVRLPYEWTVVSRSSRSGVAMGPGKPEDVANYVRARVKNGSINVGASSTRFVKVTVATEPKRELSIGVEPDARGGARSRLTFEDTTPAPEPPPDKRDPASRMESVGLSPNGKVLHPENLQ